MSKPRKLFMKLQAKSNLPSQESKVTQKENTGWKVSKYGVFYGPNSGQIQENTDQKKLRIWKLFTQWKDEKIFMNFLNGCRDLMHEMSTQRIGKYYTCCQLIGRYRTYYKLILVPSQWKKMLDKSRKRLCKNNFPGLYNISAVFWKPTF